ncbi:hypothetical protein SH1V18_32950 [Vallitalea longa]|uniref:Glycosyl transferase family 1 domain-containing protein n=1 Tax=Vallitalea longa TaxID=2936439 RepID=A0A9W5YE13_9FIRM|nr:glycosyltransferase family 4 protein [Vallitalea longa]GKX30815.1 hypothetical protein SH1V18_32950 [Vallitalea longa]
MKIKFFLSGNDLAPTTISGKLFARALIDSGYDVEIVQNVNRKKQILRSQDCDVIIFQKTVFPGHYYEDVKHLKGKVYLIYIDDDFLAMKDKGHIRALRNSNLILVGNKQHADKMHLYTKTPVETITSIHDFENYPYKSFEERKNNPLIIGWQQSLADVYVDDLLSIKNALTSIHEEYNVRLRLYGWHKGKHYNKPDNRVLVKKHLPFAEFIPFLPYNRYIKAIVPQIASSDIFIVPYLNISDRYGKSGFGLKRIMMSGVPVIVSDIGIHKELIEDGCNGFIAKNEMEWYEKLKKLIDNPELRKKFSLAGKNLMVSEYNYQKCVDMFVDAIKKHITDFS